MNISTGSVSCIAHGLLLGRDYAVGNNYRGVVGLYGSYDCFAPQIFRVSSTALSVGTTGQAWLLALTGGGCRLLSPGGRRGRLRVVLALPTPP